MRVPSRRAKRAATAVAFGVLFVASTTGEARGAPAWSWPVEGGVITHYSNDDANAYAGGMHRGIDIAAAAGTEVRAAREGEVTYAGALGYSGLTVAVRTVDGYVTSYLHLAAVAVRRGEKLSGGARVGEVGTTGRRSRPEPHLHFGVRVADQERRYVDPLTLLPALPGARPAVPATPVPAAVPVAPQPAPVRTVVAPRRVPATRRAAPSAGRVPVGMPVRAPAPVPQPAGAAVRTPAPARAIRPRPVPVAPRRAARTHAPGRAGHRPAPAPVARTPAATSDWGRPLALAGLGLLVLALCGRQALRVTRDANRAASGRAYDAIARALRPARAYLPRWR